MKKPENEKRKHWLKIRVNETEVAHLKSLQTRTTQRTLSNYVRKVALQKPVIVTYRNQSVDDFLKEMLALRKELAVIGNNFHQAVQQLHLLDRIPEFRTWLVQYDGAQKDLVGKIDDIRLRMNQLYDQWLQK